MAEPHFCAYQERVALIQYGHDPELPRAEAERLAAQMVQPCELCGEESVNADQLGRR